MCRFVLLPVHDDDIDDDDIMCKHYIPRVETLSVDLPPVGKMVTTAVDPHRNLQEPEVAYV